MPECSAALIPGPDVFERMRKMSNERMNAPPVQLRQIAQHWLPARLARMLRFAKERIAKCGSFVHRGFSLGRNGRPEGSNRKWKLASVDLHSRPYFILN